MTETEMPEHRLYIAALARYLSDCRNPKGDQGEALADLRGDGRILSRLAELAGYDADAALQGARRYVFGEVKATG